MARIAYIDLSGGMIARTGKFLMNDNELELIMNANGYDVGNLTKRHGYEIVGGAIAAADVTGLFNYHQRSTNTDRLLGTAGGSLSYSTGGAWANIAGGLTPTIRYRFATLVDSAYMVGGDGTTFANPGTITGTTFALDANIPKGNYIQNYLDQIYVLGLENNVDSFRYSSVPDSTTHAITWPVTNLEFTYGETIKGSFVNSNRLVILTQKNMYRWDTSKIDHVDNSGCVSNETIAELANGVHVFVSRSGIRAYSGGVSKKISNPIQKVFDSVTQSALLNSCAGSDEDDNYYWFVSDLIYAGSTYTNAFIHYMATSNTWYIGSWYDKFTTFTTFTDGNGVKRVYGGTGTTGSVMKMASMIDQVYSDNGHSISAKILSKRYDLGVPEDRKNVTRLITFMEKTAGAKVRFRVYDDQGPGKWQSEVQVTKVVQEHSINPDSGYFIQFEVTENSGFPSFVFEGLVIDALQATNLT